MPLVLSERALADVQPLASASPGAVGEFCSQCLAFIEGGGPSGASVFSRAAAALGCDADAVASAITALSQLLLDAARVRGCGFRLIN